MSDCRFLDHCSYPISSSEKEPFVLAEVKKRYDTPAGIIKFPFSDLIYPFKFLLIFTLSPVLLRRDCDKTRSQFLFISRLSFELRTFIASSWFLILTKSCSLTLPFITSPLPLSILCWRRALDSGESLCERFLYLVNAVLSVATGKNPARNCTPRDAPVNLHPFGKSYTALFFQLSAYRCPISWAASFGSKFSALVLLITEVRFSAAFLISASDEVLKSVLSVAVISG